MGAKAFLSGLGIMGQRHLKGLISAGLDVVAYDPSLESGEVALQGLVDAGLKADKFTHTTSMPKTDFEIAVFSETAAYRFENVKEFLSLSSANRFLLEKPLSANPEEVDSYLELFKVHNVDQNNISVNYPRQTWFYAKRLRELSLKSSKVRMTINGGAFGFGCNGIHYIDMFLFIVAGKMPEVSYCSIDEELIASGRGDIFKDYGGEFLIKNERGSLYCAGTATSSANVVFSITGDNFFAWVDESDLSWRLKIKDSSSEQPVFRFGWDYKSEVEGVMEVDSLDVLTANWVAEKESLPSLSDAIMAHHLLHKILESGGVKPPFSYT